MATDSASNWSEPAKHRECNRNPILSSVSRDFVQHRLLQTMSPPIATTKGSMDRDFLSSKAANQRQIRWIVIECVSQRLKVIQGRFEIVVSLRNFRSLIRWNRRLCFNSLARTRSRSVDQYQRILEAKSSGNAGCGVLADAKTKHGIWFNSPTLPSLAKSRLQSEYVHIAWLAIRLLIL